MKSPDSVLSTEIPKREPDNSIVLACSGYILAFLYSYSFPENIEEFSRDVFIIQIIASSYLFLTKH